MIYHTNGYSYLRTGNTADRVELTFMNDRARRVRLNYSVVLNSGATPLLTLQLRVPVGSSFAVLATTAGLTVTSVGFLDLDFPPQNLQTFIDVGPVAQNWDIAFNMDIFSEE